MASLASERKRIRQRVANGADQRRSGWRRSTLFAGLIAALALMGAATAQATPYIVNTLNDSNGAGNCSLRDAINAANGNPTSGSTCTTPGTGTDTINFSVNGTISLGSTLIVDANLTITGPTTSPGITLDGGGANEVMDVLSTTMHIANLTIANGSGDQGGGIINNIGTLTVTNSTFSGNSAPTGGGIDNAGTLTVTNSTFSGNRGIAGCIYNSGTLRVTNSTFSGNSAGREGGSIYNIGSATLKGTILAATTGGGNCNGTIDDSGYNISDDGTCGFTKTGTASNGDNVNPNLNPGGLANNGGPTMTIALVTGSPAVAAIPAASCTDASGNPLTTDQRGDVRPSQAHPNFCDIGAYEDNSMALPSCTTLGNALSFALESVGGNVTTGTNASVGKGTTPAGSVAGLDVFLGNSSGVGQDAISSSSSLILGTNANVSGACVTGGSPITISGSAARCGSTDTTGTNPLLATYSDSSTDAATFETAVIDATATQSIAGFTLAVGGSRTLTDTVSGSFNLVRINGNVVLNNSSSLTLKGAADDELVVDITGNLSLGTNSHIQLSGLSPNQVVIKVRGAVGNWGDSSSINGTLLALDSACAAGINDSVNGAVICGGATTFGSSLRVGFNPATNVCVP